MTYALKREYDSAIYFFDKAIREKGSDSLYFQFNGNNPVKEEKAQYDVDMSIIRYCRGVAYYMLNSDDRALIDFDFCLSNGYNNRGSVFLYSGMILLGKGLNENGCLNLKLALQNGDPDAQHYIDKYCK